CAYAQNWAMIWQEEFNYTGLPSSEYWGYDVGGHGWGNNELQYYTSAREQNARVENGILVIEARKESHEGSDYTSARLVSKNKVDWKYGKVEVRATVPPGRGGGPAVWLVPTESQYGNWPAGGEI